MASENQISGQVSVDSPPHLAFFLWILHKILPVQLLNSKGSIFGSEDLALYLLERLNKVTRRQQQDEG